MYGLSSLLYGLFRQYLAVSPVTTYVWATLTKIPRSRIEVVEVVECSSVLESIVILAMHSIV